MKGWIKIILIVAVLAAVTFPFVNRGILYYQYQQQIEAISIQDIDLTKLEDGVYTGTYDVGLIHAEVTVVIIDEAIHDIQLIHEHDRGQRAEGIISDVLHAQSLDVDMVTGATDSSRVILKAIEVALSE
ncbi:FMN-binding protein [Anoxynatronum sibiricum]|uniref:FMN-binding protein n=1 Tax=Anoxynatronum sibiricum TaxID=210623 RepID=A0ABU9VVB1_9CLOT